MSIRQIFVFAIGFIILIIVVTLPLWWEPMSPSIFGFPSYLMEQINAYIDAIKWLFGHLFD